jgi:rhodanese-related sulfurtransferase
MTHNFSDQPDDQNHPNSMNLPSGQRLDNQAEAAVESIKETVTAPLPSPPNQKGLKSSPKELLSRLNWGEPALTIIDARSRQAFNNERITGAVPLSLNQIADEEYPPVERNRDIYVYNDTPENTSATVQELRQAGFINVTEIQGGLEAWKQIGGPTEGVYAFSSPAKSAAS